MGTDYTRHTGSYYILASTDSITRDVIVPKLVENITNFGLDKFDAIVFRGMSGALVAPIVAYLLKKPVVLVRKDKNTHSTYWVEGLHEVNRYIVIDDLICTGKTMNEILTKMSERHAASFKTPHECVGIFLYCQGHGEKWNNIPLSAFYGSNT